ncbi:MAG: UbiA prenyltransferase family protein [Bacillota bacterium]|jgi:decaprenyl-phosphate phosphoribosyltransferase
MKSYLKLMRIHHYLKNILIFLPLIFSGLLLTGESLIRCILGFILFSMATSIVYIINDIKDVENDRKHVIKCNRPIASGEVSIQSAWTLVLILLLSLVAIIYFLFGELSVAWFYIGIYVAVNLAYSFGLKNKPIVDIAILASGFLLRVLYGSALINVKISYWLYLSVIAVSFYLSLGKRRNEILGQGNNARPVLKYYNHNFLDKNMYVSLALAIVFYSLWCVDPNTIARYSNAHIVWTVPMVMLICMKYSLVIEGASIGDPVEVLLCDKILMVLVIIYSLITFLIIYQKPISIVISNCFNI